MQKKNLARVVAALLCLAMLLGMLPVVAMADEDGLVLHYDFESLTTGTIVEDVSGNGMAGEVMPRGSGVLTEEVEIYGQKRTAIVIAGGTPEEGHNYVELPVGVLNDLDSVTISCWVYVNKTVGYGRIWDFGSNTTSYMYLLDDGYNDGHTGYTCAITGSGWSNEIGPEKGSSLATKTWKLTTVTFDGPTKTMALYEDGELIGESTTAVDLSKLQGSTQNWIGYGQFKDDMFNGMVADFRIYDYAMSEGEVAQLFEIPDENRVERDYNSLKLSGTNALEQNLKLPSLGTAGSSISWKSSDPAVITDAGVITRPAAGQPNASATLTATISYGEVSKEKTFDVTVLALPSNQKRVEDDAAALDLGNLNAVTANLSLPAKGAQDTAITWTSADPAYLSDTGRVTRPVGDPVTVRLTATVTYEEAVATRDFEVTIMPRYEKLDAVKAETVNVTTKVGIAPSLPAVVMTTFENGSTGMVKVTWPTSLNASDYAQPGTKVVTGQLVDHNVTVTANVTVVSELETPGAVAELMQLSDVTLDGDDTIYAQNMGRALEYLKVMDADRMLYNFRKTFGQDTKGARALSGWDEASGLLRGHSTGHFMSALAEAYASTGDEAYKEKLDYMIEEMRKLQLLSKGKASEFKTACTSSSAAQSKWSTDPSTWGEGFISAYSPDQFALLEQYTPYATIWAPYYTLHKLMAGFLDSYVYAGNETGLEIATDLGLWVYDRLSACTEAQRTKMWAMYIAGEYGGMNEVLARLYEITGEERLLAASQMFDNTEFFNGLAANKDTIQTRHANQHIPQIVGAIHEYAATGDPFYYNVAQHFWEMATARYAYSIGGVGTGESFKQPYKQGTNINGSSSRGENCETCAAYNMLKLTRDLYIYDPDNAAYMDYYERTVLNQIAASQSHDSTSSMHNGCTYMLPIDPGQRRDYDSDYGGFTCCNGTGMENHVIYQIAAYAKTADTLYVNLFMPSTADWAEKGVSVRQETKFPSEDSKLTVTGSGEFTMKIRVPYWATAGFTVKVNGEVICTEPEPSSYVAITRAWNDGDVVDIHMPYTLHLDKTPDTVGGSVVASLMYGPMVMVAKDNRGSYSAMNWYTLSLNDNNLTGAVSVKEPAGTGKVPHLVVEGLDFYPMYDAYNYRYHAYVKLMAAESLLNPEYLQSAVDKVTGANAPDPGDFEPAEWTAFQAALSNAQDLLARESGVTQLQLFDAQVALEAAVEGKSGEVVVQVTGISDVPDKFTAGGSLTLTGTVMPADATYKVITWSLKDAGTTGAVLTGSALTAAAAGTITVTATVAGGLDGKDYTQDFTITVEAKDDPVDPPVPPTPAEGLVLHYDFESLAEGDVVTDVSGHGNDGALVPGGNATVKEEIGGKTQTAVIIAGGQPEDGNGYVEMPAGVLNDLDSVTVSCWVYIDETVEYGRIWDFGSNTTSYMYLLDAGGNEGHEGYTAAITSSGWSNETGPVKGTNLETGVWKLTTVTFDGETNTLSLYEDGELIEAAVTSADLSVLNGSTRNWIGYGQFEDDMFNGKVADFRIYDHVLTADEIAALLEASDEPSFIAVEDISGVPAETIAGKPLTLTGTVMPADADNQTIVWSLKDAGTTGAVLSGNVLTAADPGTVIVTASVVNGAAEGQDFVKEFTITVSEDLGARAAAAAAAAAEKAAAAAEKAEAARIAAENAGAEAAGYIAKDMSAAETAAAKAVEAAAKADEAKAAAANAQTAAAAAAKAAAEYDISAAEAAEAKAEAAQAAAETAQAAAEAARIAAENAAKAQKATAEAEAGIEAAAKAAAIEAAEAAAKEAAAAAQVAAEAAEEAESYEAKDRTAAQTAAAAAEAAGIAAENAEKAAQAARDAADSASAQAAQAAAEAALAEAKTARDEAKAAAQDQKIQAEAEAAEAAAMEEAIAAAKASAAAARASADEAKAASAEARGYSAVDMTAANEAEQAAVQAEAAAIAAEGAAAAAARGTDPASIFEAAETAKAAAETAAACAEAARAAADRQAAQAAAEAEELILAAVNKAAQAAKEASAAAAEARKAADAANSAADEDRTAASAAAEAAAKAEAAAQKAMQAAAEAREAAEAADYDAAVQAAAAGAAAAEAAAASAVSAQAQAEAQAARKIAEDSAAAAEAAEKKAREAAANSEAAGDEAAEAAQAAKAAREAAEAARKAADAAKEAAEADDIEAARAARAAGESSAEVAAALQEVVAAKAEILAARAQVMEAAARTEAERKAAEEAMAAAEAANAEAARAALEASRRMAKSEVLLTAVLTPDADPEVLEAALAAIDAAEDIEAVEAALAEMEKALQEEKPECPSRNFTDVPGVDNWAHEGIDYCVANGLMNGVSDTVFDPEGTVTRAQLVTILYRAAGSPETAFTGRFADVAAGQWYSDAIEWAAANGIVNGKREDLFDPMGEITREQIAAILYRSEGDPAVDGELKFADAADVSAYAVDAMLWATSAGLINGIGSGEAVKLAPNDSATRAQIAAIIMRYLNLK